MEESKEALCRRFEAWEARLNALDFALTVIGLDANDGPPAAGDALRRERTAALHGEALRLEKDPAWPALLEALRRRDDLDAPLRRRVELRYQDYRRSSGVPEGFYIDYQRILTESRQAWLRCRESGDYAAYAPFLQRLVDAHRALYSYRASSLGLYDTMLDEHESGWTTARYDAFFRQMKERLLPLLTRVQAAEPIDDSFLRGEFPVEEQRRYMGRILDYVGFTPDWGRLGESAHPLTTWIGKNDVRITTKYRPYNAVEGVFSTVHETGHAWYVHNVAPEYDGTLLLSRISAGMHESQSRLCENHLGHALAFWECNYPALQRAFPRQLGHVSVRQFWRGINASRPSLIRTESDELTYPLHILIRYEIEKELFGGTLRAAQLEEVWREKYRAYLGLEVPDARQGVLQDMHWPYAYFGYFPTYALGSAFAAQFFHRMAEEIDVEGLLRAGRYRDVMAWLGQHVHRYGCLYPAGEILRRATGRDFDPTFYFDYLERKYTALYDLR